MSDLREKSDEELASFLKMRRRPDRVRLVLGRFLKRSNEDGREKCTVDQSVRRETKSVSWKGERRRKQSRVGHEKDNRTNLLSLTALQAHERMT